MATRRDVIAVTIGAALSRSIAPAEAQTSPKTFVLVHGAWGGGWVWRRVADLLEKRGHKVFAPTMTGVGERSHLLDAKVNLATHVADIVNLIRWEGLDNLVLVGHSYAGMVITGVVEQVQKAVASIVFLDAVVPNDGQAMADIALGPAIRAALARDEIALKPLSAAFFKVNDRDRAWVDSLCTPHPISTLTDQMVETGARERVPKRTYVRAVGFSNAAFDVAYAQYRSASGWRAYEMPCGHYVMVDLPEQLTDILITL